jgi:cold shock CspA family protein
MQNQTGTVVWFSPSQGYGRIAPDLGGEDLLASRADIAPAGVRTLMARQPVRYRLLATDYGDRAVCIHPITASAGGI